MEQKTDLSQEFGLLPSRRQQEFGSEFAALDPKTDPSPEFTHPPDTEFGNAQEHQEFAHNSTSDGTAKKRTRRERHRRTLLLQMAAVGLTAVVVSSSFGQDILGDDMLFERSAPVSSDASSSITLVEYLGDEQFENHTIYADNSFTEEASVYSGTVQYDPHSNTLILDGCNVAAIDLHQMGSDFTIYVESTSYVGQIVSFGMSNCDVFITGSPGESLLINQRDDMDWAHGIILATKDSSALTIDSSVLVDVFGASGAFAVRTTANPAIVYDPASIPVSASLQSGSFAFLDVYFEMYNNPDWTFVDETGSILNRVVFTPNAAYNPGYEDSGYTDPVAPNPGGSTGIPTTASVIIQAEGEDSGIVLYEDGALTPESYEYRHLAAYDPATNTLTLTSTPLADISVYFMPSNFTIHVPQDVSVGSISVQSGGLTISGANTMLTVNEAMAGEYGIYLDAAGGYGCLQVEPGISIMTTGTRAGLAIANSWSAPALIYDPTLTYIFEPLMAGDYGFPTIGTDYDGTQDTTMIDEKDPFQGPSTHVYIEGSYIEPEPEPPVEEPLLNQYSDLYVTLPGETTPIYIVENGQVTGNEQQVDGLTYDIITNTLTLSDYVGTIISANVMGDDFTIYLQGENQVGMIASSGNNNICAGSVTITGDRGASLILNADSSQMGGILISADNTDTSLTIDEGINVTAYGSYYAIQVSTSTAVNAIMVHESLTVTGGTIDAGQSYGALKPESMDWMFRLENREPSKEVSFRTVQQVGVYVTLTPGSEPVNIYGQGLLEVGGTSITGISCDTLYKTLYLQDFTADRIEIYGMDSFDIDLSGANQIGQIYSDGSLHFLGNTYATLAVNEELLYANGIVIDADSSESTLSAQWGPDIHVYGSDAAAIAIYDSTALNGISLGTNVLLSGYITQGSLAGDSFDPLNGVRSWTVYDTYGTREPSRYVTITSNHEGGPSEDGRLTITTDSVSTVLFADRLPTAEASSLPGISYDHVTNTLTLNGASFGHLEAYHMGAEFSIELIGENYGESIISVGSADSADGSLLISGDQFDTDNSYGSLYLTSEVNPYGILLEANGGGSVLTIDWVAALEVTAPTSAIMVHDSSAETGIVADEYMVNGQVTQRTLDTGTEWLVTDRSTGEVLTTASFYGGYGGGFYDVEHNGIIAFEPPGENAQRWIYVDTFSLLYADGLDSDYTETFDGVSYDEATNTLTLTNCDVYAIETVLMGDDFTIELIGDNNVDELIINASNVTFTGTGSLTIYGAQSGLRLEAQNRPHYIKIEYGVTMSLYSSYSAIRIHATTAEQPVILADGVSLSGTLAAGFHNDSCYSVTPDYSAGAVNYSFIDSKRSSDEYVEYVDSTNIFVTSN